MRFEIKYSEYMLLLKTVHTIHFPYIYNIEHTLHYDYFCTYMVGYNPLLLSDFSSRRVSSGIRPHTHTHTHACTHTFDLIKKMYDPILLINQVVLIIDVFFSIKPMIQYQKGLKRV
jgi:hypothetical protein